MNMLREFLNYFISVMLGRRDSLTAFLEPLTMGERYLRWGMETRDIRDFRTAIDYLHLCHDRDAPMSSLLIRKYDCIGDITAAAVESLLIKHQRVVEDSIKREDGLRDELVIVRRKIEETKSYVRRLEEEGSLIKAKDEEARIKSLGESANHLQQVIDTGESHVGVYESYDHITSDAQRFFRELDHASSMILANAMLGESAAGTLSSQLRTKLDYLRERVDKANPAAGAPAAADPAPAPASGAPSQPLRQAAEMAG